MARLIACMLIASSLMFALMPAIADGQDVSGWNVKELMSGLARIKKSKSTYVERKYLSMLKTPLKYSGTLAYTAPGRLEKRTLLPKPESMVLDQDRLVLQSGGAGQKQVLSLQENPAVWAFVESMRSTLAGDLDTLNRFYRVTLDGPVGHWRLKLQPLDLKMQGMVSEIRISGSADQINTIEIREPGGDYSVMTIIRDDS